MQINPVMAAIHTAFRLEITNQASFSNETLTITLPDQTHLVIRADQVTPSSVQHTTIPLPTAPEDVHTYHYNHQQTNNPQRLLLYSVDDCRAYLDDVVHTFLNATIRDNEVTFPNGTTYLITVEYA